MQTVTQEKHRVLLVDDEPQVLLELEKLLCDDYIVMKTTSPTNALELLESPLDIAVLLTDQRMPKMTGDELLEAAGDRCAAQRILVTGYADLASVTRAINAGRLFAYVSKPWNPTDILEKVDRAAQHFQRLRRLANERQLLQDLLNHCPDGIFFKDRDLRFVEANRAFFQMMGVRGRSQLHGRRVEDIVCSSHQAIEIEREEARVIREQSPAIDTVRAYERGEGTDRWLSETRAPVCGEDGSVVGLVGITRDVTDRVRAEHALAASEELLRKQTGMLNAILEGLAEGVVVTDAQGHFLMCNPEAERILGMSANALSIANWTTVCRLYEVDDKRAVSPEADPLARVLDGAAIAEVEMCVRGEDGGRARISLSATPLRNECGAIAGVVGLLCDITEQRAIEQRLQQAQKMDAIGRLAGGVAHDFNNLLSVIQSCGELLLRDLNTEDSKRIELEHILNASERAALLTKQLLSFSRQQIVAPRTLDLNEIVRGIGGMLRRIIGEHIEIETQLDPQLGFVSIDANQLEQVILNLAVNARDAMPNGGELRIETRNTSIRGNPEFVPPAGEWVVLTIRDTGVGMAAETQRRMFEPFYTTKEVGKGSGLGLSTVYGIVEQNGGHIRCETAPSRGAAFEIYLKRIDPRGAKSARSKPPRADSGPTARTSSAILLVEDEDSVRRVAAAILRKHGHIVLEARRPSDALHVCTLANRPIDLLLTDVVMPESSGPQLAQQLRALHPTMSVMYMSGYSDDDGLLGKAARDGVTFLHKPFTPALLLEAVHEALSRNLH